MPKFFLAYGYSDKGEKLAQRIDAFLKSLGVKTVHGKSIKPTGELNSQLKRMIANCDALVSILDASRESKYTENETMFAHGLGKPIILIAQGNAQKSRSGFFIDRYHIQLSKGEFEAASQLAAAVESVKKRITAKSRSIIKKRGEDVDARRALGIGKISDHLSHGTIKDLIGASKDIKVLKTWFPESKVIAAGLKEAIENPEAKIKLLLCNPDSPILTYRSEGANEDSWWGSVTVYHAIKNVYKWLRAKPPGASVQIACYDSWPGCPVIWYDGTILMGFYFRGDSSPIFPWVSVEKGKRMANILDRQFKELWNHPRTMHLYTEKEIKNWLKKNSKWEMQQGYWVERRAAQRGGERRRLE